MVNLSRWIKRIFRQQSIVRPRDVYAVSFPKSGRTWIELMIAKIYSDLSGHPITSILNNQVHDYENRYSRKYMPKVVFSHGYHNGKIAQGNYFPASFYEGKKIFLLVRDPRDVVVSYYYYAKWHYQSFNGSLKEFIHFPFQDAHWKSQEARFGIRPVINYMNAWVANSALFSDFHVAYYEGFKENVYVHMCALCDFIGIDVNDKIMEKAIQYGSFDNMRRLELSGELGWHGLEGANDTRGLKTRQGEIGGYRENLDQEDIEFINGELDTDLAPFFEKYLRIGKDFRETRGHLGA